MPAGPAPTLVEAFGLARRRYVHLIGGGGKTTLMFAAARALVAAGRTVLTTTSTRILWPGPDESTCVVQGSEATPLIERLRAEFAARPHVTVVAPGPDGGRKVAGLPLAVLDMLAASRVADHVLVEADGAAGRPLKAHLGHEPVVSARADLVIAVVGVDCVGAPMDDAHVHRAALLRERLGRAADAVVAPGDVAATLLGPGGWLARVGARTQVIAFLNKADTPELLASGRRLAAVLRERDRERRLARVVVGDVRSGAFEVSG